MITVCTLHHRGFALVVCARPRGEGHAYAFRLSQGGLALHTSRAVYRSVASADRAGRRFVDDALAAYAFAAEHLEADDAGRRYSSSK